MYFTAEVKEKLRAHPVGIPWLNETDSYAAKQFLDKAKDICGEQVIGNIPQHTNKLREVVRLTQQYYEIFSDLNRMTDWTVRVATQLEVLKDTLADPWCLLTSPAPLEGELQKLYTFQPDKSKTNWRPEVNYEPWESKSLAKAWPNSQLKINRSPQIQPESCQSPRPNKKRNSKVRPQNRKSTEIAVDQEVQSEDCKSPCLPRYRFPRKSHAEIKAMLAKDDD